MIKDKIKIFELGNSKAIYIPASIRNDSAYPFNNITEINIKIDGDKLVLYADK